MKPKEILTDEDLLAMPKKQLLRLFREEQKKSDEFQSKYNRFLYWLNNSAEFSTGQTFSKNGDF